MGLITPGESGTGGSPEMLETIGGAILGGDKGGDARGFGSLDIQADRSAGAQVASGGTALAFGIRCTAAGSNSAAVGVDVNVQTDDSFSIGRNNSSHTGVGSFNFGKDNEVSGEGGTAVGIGVLVSADFATGLGFNSKARIYETTNICGPQIIRKDNGESGSEVFRAFSGVETVMMTSEFDLKTVADVTITLPSGCNFFPDEVDLIITSANTVTIQPTVRAGYTGTPAGLIAEGLTTGLTAATHRQRFNSLISSSGRTSLTAGTTVGATATTMLGRFAFRGLLVEDE